MKPIETKKSFNHHGDHKQTNSQNKHKTNYSNVQMQRNESKPKVAMESLASRAKRSSEDKVKQFYKNRCSPTQDRKVKSKQHSRLVVDSHAGDGKQNKKLRRYSSNIIIFL